MIIAGGDKLKDFINKVAKQKARVDIGFLKSQNFLMVLLLRKLLSIKNMA